ncbi:MAG: CUB domain-containing protein, partial [Flavobacteriales bacterium]|nr:CUB domain-containing protein [Flavobacteriales bacterium]
MLNYRPLHILVVCTSLLCMHLWTAAQELPEFDMSDTTITVCDGILYDSGGVDEIYGVNEVITTVINTGGVITLTFFNDFCYENNLDFLYVYDGPDTSAPLLGVFTGSTLPPVLVANSGSVTIVSTSDTSVSYCGFAFEWDTDLPEPIPPVISVDTPPVCNSNAVMVNFSYNVACWWLDLDEFVVALESSGNTIDVLDINYPCIADSASFVQLELATPVNINCPYTVNMILPVADDCGLIY